MNFRLLLDQLKDCVPVGTVTTYGDLSNWAYGNSGSAPAIVSMLNAAVRDQATNSKYTNRVVAKSGNIVDVNGQLDQLLAEGVPIKSGYVDMSEATVAVL